MVTTADTDQIAKGTLSFVERLLADLEVRADVREWSVDFCRTQYFSDYLDSDDWRDRWQPAWRIVVAFRGTPPKLRPRSLPYVETNATDDSWTPNEYHGAKTSARCLVIADFRSVRDLRRTLEETSVAGRVEGVFGKPGALHQVHFNLGVQPAQFFQSGSDAVSLLTQQCRRRHARLHYEESQSAYS